MVKKPRCPQQPFIRHILRQIGRILPPLLARVKIEGREYFPRTEPLIVIGNHIVAMERLLLIYAPRIAEHLGSISPMRATSRL
jgi:1-acyl-sn-glycerol-3-phosphate acyltransferase